MSGNYNGKRRYRLFTLAMAAVFLLTSVSACSGYYGQFGSGYRQLALKDQKKADSVVKTARSQLGRYYRYGGSTPKTGFDCSGLIYWVYRQQGVQVPRVARDQAGYGRKVDPKSIAVGDIVVFKISSRYHTGIYSGNGKFIHSPKVGAKVREESLTNDYWRKNFHGVRRVI